MRTPGSGNRRAPRERLAEQAHVGDAIEVVGRVTRQFFKNEKWCAGIFLVDGGKDEFKFAGSLTSDIDELVRIAGKWVESKYGLQVQIESWSFETPVDRAGLIDFLARSTAFVGIGPTRAVALVEAAGDDFEAALAGDLDALAARAGIKPEIVSGVRDEWFGKRDQNRCVSELGAYGVTPNQALRIFKRWGPRSIAIVRENPYWLIGKVQGFGFKTVDQIAMRQGIAKILPERMRACLEFVLKEERSEGHTWMPERLLIDAALLLLTFDLPTDAALLDAELAAAVEDKTIACLPNVSVRPMALARLHEDEVYVTRTIVENASRPADTSGATMDPLAIEPRLNAEQAAAVRQALTHRLSVVTGGAGVGKTFVISTIVAAFRAAGKTAIELSAPTGKAAKRMEETVGRGARTIHRMLEPLVSEGDDGDLHFGFGRGQGNEIDADLIVVDEVSMVDVPLFADLLRAIDFSRTSLVLVGDYNQLPPVGPGSVLRDLVDQSLVPVARLIHVVRQAGALKHAVSATLEGVMTKGPTPGPGATTFEPWYVFDQWMEPEQIRAFVCYLFRDRFPSFEIEDPKAEGGRRKLDPFWDVQLLTPMHKGEIGTQALNIELQKIAQKRLGNPEPEPTRPGARPPIAVGDKVIQTKNDYKLQIFNGTIGRVLSRFEKGELVTIENQEPFCADDGSVIGSEPITTSEESTGRGMVIDFEGRQVMVQGEQTQNLSLAYALTVHKSQGSEFPVVVSIFHKSHHIMLNRSLLYTAVSRSRQVSMVVGDRYGIAQAVRTVKIDKRRTLLALMRDHGLGIDDVAPPPREVSEEEIRVAEARLMESE